MRLDGTIAPYDYRRIARRHVERTARVSTRLLDVRVSAPRGLFSRRGTFRTVEVYGQLGRRMWVLGIDDHGNVLSCEEGRLS